ncbi:FHA domain-containing protein [Stieleria sp. TO1_6]|uniref:FHA domain-containing protein n=1 Tax=Stieleria tagensis TaxID=2956795 RepID=UPI00209A7969|nr:FHA domain-containing protein [Stieleria tagensis]MCO8125449.1 FHA domain-containing protein [Stieleria tagensis]
MNYKFVLVDHQNASDKSEWVLSPPVTVGRCPTVDITLNDGSISRKHCQFLIDPYDSLIVRDLGSKNGVFIDEQRVEKAIVVPGTNIRIGMVNLRAELTDEELDQIDDDDQVFDLDAAYDLGETHPVKIYRPEADV